ncbi:MAG: hypothetical protein JNJ60_10855, partial [Rhodocyclaceae bacterium]|nr:hypothetical protein [Rhodocyclaceae bacterium]
GDLSLSGNSTWSGGTWAGAGSTTIANGATLSVSGSTILAGRALTNAGTTTVNGNVELDGSASIHNSGTLNLQTGSVADNNASPGSLSLTNAAGASLTKTGGGSFALNASLTNSGSLDIQSGSLSLPGFNNNPGSINIAAGASLTNGGGALSNSGTLSLSGGSLASGALSNSGSVAGSGTLDLGGATLSNDGTLSPGGAGATGTLTILGNYSQSTSGRLNAELASASDYDRLTASGSIALDGRLSISQLNGYNPSAGASHTVLTCSAGGACLTGRFSQIDYPAGGNLTPVYAGQSFSLNLIDLIKRWISDASGNWEDAANWSGGSVPVASDSVVIDRGSANPVVTLSSERTAQDLNLTETVRIVGGSLSLGGLNGGATRSGSVQLAGGNLTLSGPSALDQLTQTSGSLTQSGGSFNANSASLSGGTTGINGAASIGDLTVSGTAAATFGSTLTSSGTVTVNAGSL